MRDELIFIGIIVFILVCSLMWAWDKIRGLEGRINWLQGFVDTSLKKVESLEQDLLEKKVIDSYHKSPEELRKEKTIRELDKEMEDHLKRVEGDEKNNI